MSRTFPIPEVAQRLIGFAISAAQDENHEFYIARYNSASLIVGDTIKSEDDIRNVLYAAYAEASILMLGSECACPYSSFVSDEMLHYARSEFLGFRDLHEEVERFVSERWSGEIDGTDRVFGIVAEWLSVKLLKDPNDTATETFCRHFRNMKVGLISLIGEYFSSDEVP